MVQDSEGMSELEEKKRSRREVGVVQARIANWRTSKQLSSIPPPPLIPATEAGSGCHGSKPFTRYSAEPKREKPQAGQKAPRVLHNVPGAIDTQPLTTVRAQRAIVMTMYKLYNSSQRLRELLNHRRIPNQTCRLP